MEVLHVINSLAGGGAETLLLRLAECNSSFDILLLTSKIELQVPEDIRKRIEILNAKSNYSFSILKKLKKKMKEYDIVHAHLFPSFYWVALAKSKRNKIVLTEHSTSNRRRRRALFRILDKIIYSKYDKIVAISEGVSKKLVNDLNIKKNLVKVVHNGINLEKFESSRSRSYDGKSQFKIIMVSSFNKAKDQDTVVRALACLNKNYHLTFVGKGEREEIVKSLVNELGISERVTFAGFQTDILSSLNQSHLAIQSSHWEGFGLAAVECMASGLPVLATNVDGLKEVIPDSRMLFEVGDYNLLADMISQLMENSLLRTELSEKCCDSTKKFDIQTCNKDLDSIYLELLER